MTPRKWIKFIATGACAGLLLGVGGAEAHSRIPWAKLTPSDWGTWIGALGTVFTLIGTIWIATSQARRVSRIERTTAHIVAAALAPRLAIQVAIVMSFRARLTFGNSEGRPFLTPAQEASAFLESDSADVSVDELIALAPLGNNCANRLAHAIALLNSAKWQIRGNVRAAEPGIVLPAAQAQRWCALLSEISDRLEVVCGICEAIAKVHATRPSGEELY